MPSATYWGYRNDLREETSVPSSGPPWRARLLRLGWHAAAVLGVAVLLHAPWRARTFPSSSSPFVAVRGLFLQESGHRDLPRQASGNVQNFGARGDWQTIHDSLGPGRKLLLLLRHAEGFHNQAQALLGRDHWRDHISQGCTWNTEGDMFDSPLTPVGLQQARALNAHLRQADHLHRLAPDLSRLRVLSSPLTRTLRTVLEVLKGVGAGRVTATELCREALGLFPCDARRSMTGIQGSSPCAVRGSLRQDFAAQVDLHLSGANLSYPISPAEYHHFLRHGAPLGLMGDADPWWRPGRREAPMERAARARLLLASVFDHVPEPVVLIATHAGFIGAVTRDLGQEAYLAENCEIVPVVVEDRRPPETPP